jgi:cytosolic iron-sulfur protein assembly protein CIAO1
MEIVQTQSLQSHEDKVWALAWHHSGEFLATGSSDKLIKIWGKSNGESGEELTHKSTLDGAHTRTVRSLAWKPGCQVGSLVLASSSFDATACIWMQEGFEQS